MAIAFGKFSLILLAAFIGQVNSDAPADGAPVITEHPLDVIVPKGEPATLNCAAKGVDLQIVWYKDGEPVITNKDETNSHRLVLHTGALFLLRVNNGKSKDADSGTYYCVAKNKFGEARSREASLKIAFLRDDFRIRPRPVQAVIGNRAVLECSPPRGFPEPVVSWRKGEHELRSQDQEGIVLHPSGNLIIEKVQKSNAGLYQCVATNMVGERLSNPARLSVYEKPDFLKKPQNVTAEVGTSVLFDCRVSGDPIPSISWKKRNQQMPVGRAYIASDNRGLRIDKVQSSDQGEYICQAKNPAGSIEASAQLNVHEAPSFTKTPTDVIVKSGSVARFKCEAEGQPQPALFWSREGQQELFFPGHISLDGRVSVTSDGELRFNDVRPVDEGNYVCAAMNLAGSSLAKASLKVTSTTLSSNPPPIIKRGHSNQTVMIGGSATLLCEAIGRTLPQISWLKNGKQIDFDDQNFSGRFKQQPSGSLQITNLGKSDSGVYTCRARNEDGESTWAASLSVEEHSNPAITFSRMPEISAFPTAPGKPFHQNITEDSVDLEWALPDKNGASPITGYLLQYFSPKMGETWFNIPDYISGPRYQVKNLKSAQSYTFIVRAENSFGIGPPSSMSDVIKLKHHKEERERELASQNVDLDNARQHIASEQLIKLEEARTLNSTAVKLTWKRRRNEPLIDGYYIKWRVIPTPSSNKRQHSGGTTDNHWVNISNANIDSYVVNGLSPFTNYEFFVIPYHRSVQGMPSNSLDASTSESHPTSAPTDVRVRMMNLTTLRISWRPPPPDGLNGILKGFQIIILGNGAKYNRNITTNERAASVTLFHLVPGMTYGVKVAAKNNAGIGIYHGLEAVTMNEATLREHIQLLSGLSGGDRILHTIRRPWFIATSGVLIWILFIALITFVWWRKRKSRGKNAARLGMPFIKINDGSVHLTARDALWMDHPNFNSAQRSLLLNNPINGSNCNGPPIYTQTPHQTDFHIDAHRDNSSHMIATMDRAQSPHHYHYAALTTGGSGMSTFYGGHQIMDDPSPYATTTLVMGSRQRWLKDHMLRAPLPPTNPVPSGPPPRFKENFKQNTLNDRYSASANSPSFMETKLRTIGHHSPPHTDVSYVQSSDGTGGSSNGRSKAGTLSGRRSPPKQTLMDLIPPPPPEVPPSDHAKEMIDSSENPLTAVSEHYDAVSDALLSERESRYMREKSVTSNNRPNSRTKTNNRNRLNSFGCQDGNDDNSQRSSLMLANNRSAFYSSSEADEENSEDERIQKSRSRLDRSQSPDYAAHRPSQPCMGVSASALTQSSYDGAHAIRSSSRLKSLSRIPGRDMI